MTGEVLRIRRLLHFVIIIILFSSFSSLPRRVLPMIYVGDVKLKEILV
jgi:predicted RND superfamily exporter protein